MDSHYRLVVAPRAWGDDARLLLILQQEDQQDSIPAASRDQGVCRTPETPMGQGSKFPMK